MVNKEQSDNVNAYARLFTTGDGKAVLKDLESFCCQSRSSVNEENPNSFQTFFCEGKRRVYLRIMSFIKQEQELRKEQTNDRNK
jgi:hypothetical protein